MTRTFDRREFLALVAAAPMARSGHRVRQAKIELLFKSPDGHPNALEATAGGWIHLPHQAMKRVLWLLAACWLGSARADEVWRILRPVDRAALQSGDLNIVATAPRGRLELDGKPIAAEEPFKNVLHARSKASPGAHTLALAWDGGRHEIRFFVGANATPEFKPYRAHPPAAEVACTQCHGLSKRGRFRFKGGCFDCHATDAFARVHTHNPDFLAECGECHNAHGSTERAHLVIERALACKLCHN